jgi:hypothetical protein
MRSKIHFLTGGAALSLLLGACGGEKGGSMPPAMPMPPMPPPTMTKPMNLDTAAVLVIVQTKTSETAAPFAVDGGAVAVTPVGDETSPPLSVDAT